MGSHDDLLARHGRVLPSWLALYYDEPIALERGSGRHVWDAEGTRYLDFFGGILTTMTGHAVPEVVAAVREQAGRLLHSSTLYLVEPMIALAEEIARVAPMPDAKAFFVCSGSEANETALLLACTARRSNQVLALRNSYHGRSFATMGITGNRGWSASSLTPVNVSYVYGGYRYRSPFAHLDDDAFVSACVDDLRSVIETTTAGDVACLIAEPIQGVGGFTHPPDGLFAAFKQVLDEYGILLVADEVQTGWGRTGAHLWGISAHEVVPDLLTFAKGLGNGLTIGGVVGRAELVDAVEANSISTFGGNPLSSAGALANLRYLFDHDLQGNARKVGEHLLGRLREATTPVGLVGEVRGKGLMIGIELVHAGGTEPHPQAAARVLNRCKDAGLLVGKGGLHGNVVRVSPPLSLTREEADAGADILLDVVSLVDRETGS